MLVIFITLWLYREGECVELLLSLSCYQQFRQRYQEAVELMNQVNRSKKNIYTDMDFSAVHQNQDDDWNIFINGRRRSSVIGINDISDAALTSALIPARLYLLNGGLSLA